MRRRSAAAFPLTLVMLLALAGCEKGKPRHVPPDPFAAPPAAAAAAADGPAAGLSAGLTKLSGAPGWFVDHIGGAIDPLNHPPAVTAADAPLLLDGFGFDSVAKKPGKGIDVVIDGKAYGTAYPHARPDVGIYFKTPELAASGFRTTLPAGAVAAGTHTLRLRVVAADGAGYFESPPVAFTVQ